MRQNNVFVSERDSPKCSFQVTFEAGRASEADDNATNESVASRIRARDFIAFAAEHPASLARRPWPSKRKPGAIAVSSAGRWLSLGCFIETALEMCRCDQGGYHDTLSPARVKHTATRRNRRAFAANRSSHSGSPPAEYLPNLQPRRS